MKNYIISEETLKELLEDSWELTRLINNGVDNWQEYYEEMKIYKENFKTPSGEEIVGFGYYGYDG